MTEVGDRKERDRRQAEDGGWMTEVFGGPRMEDRGWWTDVGGQW